MTANGYFCQFSAEALRMKIGVSELCELTLLCTAVLAAKSVGLDIMPDHEHRQLSEIYLPTHLRRCEYLMDRNNLLRACNYPLQAGCLRGTD